MLSANISNMAFSVGIPLRDPVAEAKLQRQYATDPGASLNGSYITTQQAVSTASLYPDIRLMTVGNKKECPQPLEDFNRSRGLGILHPWSRANSTFGPPRVPAVSALVERLERL